jgi:hypothetical protein
MLRITFIALLLVLSLTVSVPCNQNQASVTASASDCTVDRKSTNSIAWTATINFKANVQWS